VILSSNCLQNHHDVLGTIVSVVHVHPTSRELADGGAHDMQGVEIEPYETLLRKQMWREEKRTHQIIDDTASVKVNLNRRP
jgi:hypothetical protein